MLMNDTKTDDYKKIVADSFSASKDFWKYIYDIDKRGIDKCYSNDMINRKSSVFDLLQKYSNGKKLNVLDVGCGAGVFVSEAVRLGHLAYGVDFSELMVQESKSVLTAYGYKNTVVIRGDIEHLPIRDEAFDVALCIGVLSYLPTDEKGLSELRRVVKKGGYVIIALPNWLRLPMLFDPYYYFNRIFVVLFKKLFNSRNHTSTQACLSEYRRYFVWRLTKLFSQFNFKILETRNIGFGPPTFWKKEIIAADSSIKISQFLERLSRIKLFYFLKAFTNHWVICLQKT